MKIRSRSIFPQSLVLCMAPILASTTLHAAVINFNEQSTENVWTFKPYSVNLLAGATITASQPLGNHGENTSTSWAPLTDGSLGNPDGTDNDQSVSPNNGTSVTYALDLTNNPDGHNITSFDAYGAWANTGRDNLDFTVEYSIVGDETTFQPLATVSNHTPFPGSPLRATHTSITDTSGYLAFNVHSIRFNFNNQENGYVGYREFILRADSDPIQSINEANVGNIWTLPPGANLLRHATDEGTVMPAVPDTSTRGNGDNTSASWSTLTDGQFGVPANQLASVAPSNNTTVTFPLDLSVNTEGYDITSFDSYAAWRDSGRDNQDFSIRYETKAFPGVFIPLAEVANHTSNPQNATHTSITSPAGVLAHGVTAIQIRFANQENGYVGYREFVALGSAVSISDPLQWTGTSGSAGSATWNTSNPNWKSASANPSPYVSTASLTFTNASTNNKISVSPSITAFSMTFANDVAHPYVFSGSELTVTNDLMSEGAGTVTFNNPVTLESSVKLAGSGSLVFNDNLQAAGLFLAGAGKVTINSDTTFAGTIGISEGTLNVNTDSGLGNGIVMLNGGALNLKSANPAIFSLSGSYDGSIVLGNSTTPVGTSLHLGFADMTTYSGNISQAAGDVGKLVAEGPGAIVLAGTNTYTGSTIVNGGTLEFATRTALYDANPAAWTASNLKVGANGVLSFRVGGFDEFTEAELHTMPLGGFQPDSYLGINTTMETTLSRNLTQPGVGLVKSGLDTLNLTGMNTSTGTLKVLGGALNAASVGTAIPGNVTIGDGSAAPFLNMGDDNQFGPDSVITMAAGGYYGAKLNLRGTDQTVAGLESSTDMRVSLIQNDEVGNPGFTTNPGPASLTINAATDHSFYGLIRNQDGDPVSVIKNGPGTQEFINSQVEGYRYTGPTTINEGTLRLNLFGVQTSFESNVTIAAPATLAFNATGGDYNFDRIISGEGKVTVTGTNAIRFTNGGNSFSGGLTVGSPEPGSYNGFLALVATGPVGAGTGPGQTCVGGAMVDTHVITVNGGATLAIDNGPALGDSTVLPQWAPSIVINHSGLSGGGNTVAFVSNLTLNGSEVTIRGGAATGGFDTNLAFVGTVIVGGDSVDPSTITTPEPGPYANVSLGSLGLPGTIFQVADVTNDADVDFAVAAMLRDVSNVPSPLVKKGAGTMSLEGPQTYTGPTTILEGELRFDTATLADEADVTIAGNGILHLMHSDSDQIRSLTLGGIAMDPGTYGSMTNTTSGVIKTPRIVGDGVLLVSTEPAAGYDAWALQIPDAGKRGRTDDPDGDGFNNLQEFLFGTSPNAANGALSAIERSGSGLILRWNERDSGSSVYVLQESGTLENPWTESSATITDAAVQDLSDYIRKEAAVPFDAERKFLRIKATE